MKKIIYLMFCLLLVISVFAGNPEIQCSFIFPDDLDTEHTNTSSQINSTNITIITIIDASFGISNAYSYIYNITGDEVGNTNLTEEDNVDNILNIINTADNYNYLETDNCPLNYEDLEYVILSTPNFDVYYSYYNISNFTSGNYNVTSTSWRPGLTDNDNFTTQFYYQIPEIPEIPEDTTISDSCNKTKNTIFAAFSLIVIIILASAAFTVYTLFSNGGDTDIIFITIIGMIALTIVLFVGYVIISHVGSAIC